MTKSYRREADRQPHWREVVCVETNNHVEIGKQDYVVGPDGRLMPTRKDQPPPDLRYFNRSARRGRRRDLEALSEEAPPVIAWSSR